MELISYQYDVYLIFTAILTSLVGTYTSISIIQNIRYCHTLKAMLLLTLISSISLSALSVWTTHFLMIYAMQFEGTEVYIRIDYTIISLLVSIICKVLGYYLSFLTFLKRVKIEFEVIIEDVSQLKVEVKGKDNGNAKDRIIDYADAFNKTKLLRKDYIYIALGALFIGPSIMLLHIVGMLALQIKGEVDFGSSIQIAITVGGIFASVVVNFAFFLNNTIILRIALTCIISGAVLALHCLSIHHTVFQRDPTVEYKELNEIPGLISVALGSKIILGLNSFLAYIFNEISYTMMRNSWRIINDLGLYMKLDNTNYKYINRYIKQYKKENKLLSFNRLNGSPFMPMNGQNNFEMKNYKGQRISMVSEQTCNITPLSLNTHKSKVMLRFDN
jgi:NO-binding membrane sensor protein with MHYT domain